MNDHIQNVLKYSTLFILAVLVLGLYSVIVYDELTSPSNLMRIWNKIFEYRLDQLPMKNVELIDTFLWVVGELSLTNSRPAYSTLFYNRFLGNITSIKLTNQLYAL